MSERISNDLSAEVSSASVEIISWHGGNIVVDSDEIPALIAFLKSAQHSAQSDTKACAPGKHELFKSEEIWLFCPNCGQRL